MDLEEFVATAIQQLVAGVRKAQDGLKGTGARVNPQVASGAPGRFDRKTGTHIQDLSFDVAVTIGGSEKSGARLNVGVAFLGGGIEGGSAKENVATSRLQFTVPLLLPMQEIEPPSS